MIFPLSGSALTSSSGLSALVVTGEAAGAAWDDVQGAITSARQNEDANNWRMMTLRRALDARAASPRLSTPLRHKRTSRTAASMTVRSLFASRLYEAEIQNGAVLRELAHSIRSLAQDDAAGRRWSQEHRYPGYTSYSSLNDLPKRDPAFADLTKILGRHAANFSTEAGFDLNRKPRLDSLWVNLLKASGHHSGHIHPHSIISGTFYVEVPP